MADDVSNPYAQFMQPQDVSLRPPNVVGAPAAAAAPPGGGPLAPTQDGAPPQPLAKTDEGVAAAPPEDPYQQFIHGTVQPGNSSTFGTFLSHAVQGVSQVPTTLMGVKAGAEIGASAGAVAGAFFPPAEPFAIAAGGIIGAIGGGILAGHWLGQPIAAAQNWALEKLPDNAQEALGVSERQRTLQEQQHHLAATIGDLTPFILTSNPAAGWTRAEALAVDATLLSKIATHPLTGKAAGGVMMGGLDLVNQWDPLHRDSGTPPINWQDVAVSTVFGIFTSTTNRLGQYIETSPQRLVNAYAAHVQANEAALGIYHAVDTTNLSGQPQQPARPPTEAGDTGTPFSGWSAVHQPLPPLIPGEPTIVQAAAYGVMGPGITESTFRGGERVAPDARATAVHDEVNERALFNGPEQPHPDDAARLVDREAFDRRDEIIQQRENLRTWVADQSNPPDSAFEDLEHRRRMARLSLDATAARPNSLDARRARSDLAELDRLEADLQGRRDAWASGQHVDTPDIARAREELVALDSELGRLGPRLSAARRAAAERHGLPIEEAPPAAAPLETAPAAAAATPAEGTAPAAVPFQPAREALGGRTANVGEVRTSFPGETAPAAAAAPAGTTTTPGKIARTVARNVMEASANTARPIGAEEAGHIGTLWEAYYDSQGELSGRSPWDLFMEQGGGSNIRGRMTTSPREEAIRPPRKAPAPRAAPTAEEVRPPVEAATPPEKPLGPPPAVRSGAEIAGAHQNALDRQEAEIAAKTVAGERAPKRALKALTDKALEGIQVAEQLALADWQARIKQALEAFGVGRDEYRMWSNQRKYERLQELRAELGEPVQAADPVAQKAEQDNAMRDAAARAEETPGEIEEGEGLSQRAPDDDRKTFTGGPVGQDARIEPLTANAIRDPDVPALPARSKGVGVIAKELMARGSAALKALGYRNGRITEVGPREQEILASALASELRHAIETSDRPNATEWYTGKVREAMAVAAVMHPELATDRGARMAYTAAMAITSQGETVPRNTRAADEAYRGFKETGRFPTTAKFKKNAVNDNFKKLNNWLDAYEAAGHEQPATEALADFLDRKFTVRELEALGYSLSGENKGTEVYGSAILGPKIGNGFYQNLNGNFTPVTFDLWFMRGWGRLTGTLVGQLKPEAMQKIRERFEEALVEEGHAAPKTLPALKRRADDIVTRHERVITNIQKQGVSAAGYEKSELTLSAYAFVKGLDGVVEAPSSGGQRTAMRGVVERAREMLADVRSNRFPDGIHLTNADAQAVWWYPEKDLYAKLGGRDSDAINIDYATALRAIAKEKGIADEQLDAAVRSVAGGSGPGETNVGRRDGGRGGEGREALPGEEGQAGAEEGVERLYQTAPSNKEEAFNGLASAQRDAPERAMLRAQATLKSGVMAHALEHVGDLTHRMAEHAGRFGDEYVAPKVARMLRALTSGYGFDYEHRQNMTANRVTRADEATALADYSYEHAKLRVYNRAQELGRNAAVHLGDKNYDAAITDLRELDAMIKDGSYERVSQDYDPNYPGKVYSAGEPRDYGQSLYQLKPTEEQAERWSAPVRTINPDLRARFGNATPQMIGSAKYILPDGGLMGVGEADHAEIARGLGYGGRGDQSVHAMMDDMGAIRINIASAMFRGGGGDVSISRPPTNGQIARLAQYANDRTRSGFPTTTVSYLGEMQTVHNGGEMRAVLEGATAENTRNVSYELDFGAGSPYEASIPEWQQLAPDQRVSVTNKVMPVIIDAAKRIAGAFESDRLTGLGGWHEWTNPAFKSRLVAPAEVAGDFADIIGYLAQQTKIFGYRLAVDGKRPGLMIHGTELHDPAVVQKLWDHILEKHSDMAAGFSPSVDSHGTPGIEIILDNADNNALERIRSDLIPSVQEFALAHDMELDAHDFKAEEESAGNEWTEDPTGGGYLSRLIARHGPEIRERLELLGRETVEPEIRRAIADELGSGDRADAAGEGRGASTAGGERAGGPEAAEAGAIGEGNERFQTAGAPAEGSAEEGGLSLGRGVPGGEGVLHAPGGAVNSPALEGLPRRVKVPATGESIQAGPDPRVRQAAVDYMREAGLPYDPPSRYVHVDPARARRIADAFDRMIDDPGHPLVKASYEALAKETMAQYHAATRAGLKLEFWDPATEPDPYAASPRLATEDVRDNNHMFVFPTDAGYGERPITAEDIAKNPLLADSGERWNGKVVRVNDIFRAIHDYYGHAKEGVGFRADGEENAWRSHSAMFSPLARLALTTETRGQNSWLNYGPHGETNRTAAVGDTVFADQKIGVLPSWTLHDGAGDFMQPRDIAAMEALYKQHGMPDEGLAQAARVPPKERGAGGEYLGMYTPTKMGFFIDLFRNHNPSTLIHEFGHAALRNLFALAQEEGASANVQRLARLAREFLGMRPDQFIPNEAQHEKFARTNELYLMEGHAPSKRLEPVFAYFRRMLVGLYKTVDKLSEHAGFNVKITPETRELFDHIYSTAAERKTYGESRLREPTAADVHEADVREVAPDEAESAGDRVTWEKNRHPGLIEPGAADELARAGEATTSGTDPAGEAGAGAAGPGSLDEGGGRPGAVAPGAADRGGDGAVEQGGGGAIPARPGSPAGTELARAGAPEPLQMPGPGKPDNIRVENLTSREGIADRISESVERTNGPDRVLSMSEQADMADQLGLERTIDLAGLARMFGGTYKLGAKIWRLREIVDEQSVHVNGLMRAVAANPADEALTAAFALEIARLDMLVTTLSGVTTEAGRGLGMGFRNLEAWNKAQTLNQYLQGTVGKSHAQLVKIAKLAESYDSTAQMVKLARDMEKHSYGRMIVEYWINGLISGVATHMTYGMSNIMLAIQKMGPETAMAAAIGAGRAKLGRQGERVLPGEVGMQFRAAAESLPTAGRAAMAAVRTGVTTRLPGERSNSLLPLMGVRANAPSAVMDHTPSTWGELGGDIYSSIQGARDGIKAGAALIRAGGPAGAPAWGIAWSPTGAIPDFTLRGANALPLGTIARLPSRMVAAMHSTFRAVNYSTEIATQAYRMAVGEGLTGTALDARVSDLRKNPTPDMMDAARRSSNDLTLMGAGGKFVATLSKLTNHEFNVPGLGPTPLLKFVDPFVHISSNIIDQALMQRTPIGLVSSGIRATLAGEHGNVAADTAAAKMLTGTLYAVAIMGMAAEGLVNGSGPSDPNKKAMWMLAGNLPHGMRIGDMWYDMHRLGPLGMLASVAADMHDVGHFVSEGEGTEAAKALMRGFAQNLLDESFMRGPADLMAALTDPERHGSNYIRQFASSFVPYSVGMAQMARAADPYSREARSVMDAVRNKVPGLSDSLFPRRDIWGEPMPVGDALFSRAVTAIYERQMTTDPVNLAMLELGMAPAPVARTIRNVKLTDEQHDEYAMIAGRLLKGHLDALVSAPIYQSMNPSERHGAFVKIIADSREVASGLMMGKYPEIPREATKVRMDRATGAPKPIQ